MKPFISLSSGYIAVAFVSMSNNNLSQSFIDREKHHGPMLAVIECPNIHLMKSGIPALDNFPCVSIPSNIRDSQYQVTHFRNHSLLYMHKFAHAYGQILIEVGKIYSSQCMILMLHIM